MKIHPRKSPASKPVAAPYAPVAGRTPPPPPTTAEASATPDVNREQLSLTKAYWMGRVVLARLTGRAKQSETLPSFHELAGEQLTMALQGLSLRSFPTPGAATCPGVVLFDFDGTLAPQDSLTISQRSIDLVTSARDAGFVLGVLSNKQSTPATRRRYESLVALGVHIAEGVPAKPNPAAFQLAVRQLAQRHGVDSVDPRSVVVIGDNPLTDGGAVLAGMHFLRVRRFPSSAVG